MVGRCPVCMQAIPSQELEKHVNNHLDNEDMERDAFYAQEVERAANSETQGGRMEEEAIGMRCTFGCGQIVSYLEWDSHCLQHQLEAEETAAAMEQQEIGQLALQAPAGNARNSPGWSELSGSHNGSGEAYRLAPSQPAEGKTHVGLRAIQEDIRQLTSAQVQAEVASAEEGLVPLLRRCLEAEQQGLSRAALSGFVDHYCSQRLEDLGWGCGWRNIQMLCSHLMQRDQGAQGALFGGAALIPEITALQRWLELAWRQGFDEVGAQQLGQRVVNTHKWIGTTECAALLRSFGFRARIVDFKSSQGQAQPGQGGEGGSGPSGHGRREGEGEREEGAGGGEDDRPQKRARTGPSEEQWAHGASSGGEEGERSREQTRGHPAAEGQGPSGQETEELEGGSGGPAGEDAGAEASSRDLQRGRATEPAGAARERGRRTEGWRECWQGGPAAEGGCWSGPRAEPRVPYTAREGCHVCPVCLGEAKKSANSAGEEREDPSAAAEPGAPAASEKQEPRGMGGGGGGEADLPRLVMPHRRLVEWVWEYFTEGRSAGRPPGTAFERLQPPVYLSGKPPLYFQHQGHSRTIVGIERRRRQANAPEDVFLLVLDPSQQTEELVRCLRQRRGWQKMVKRGVHTLRKAEYQLCYVEPGLAVGEELERLKVLESVLYSY